LLRRGRPTSPTLNPHGYLIKALLHLFAIICDEIVVRNQKNEKRTSPIFGEIKRQNHDFQGETRRQLQGEREEERRRER